MRRYLILTTFCFLQIAGGSAQTRDLDFFIQTTIKNSSLLKGYQNQILSLRIDSMLLKASMLTQVKFISNDSYAPVIRGWGYDEAITNIANVNGVFQASRNYFTPKNISLQYKAIALQRQGLLDTIQLSRQDLLRTVTDQYITAYGDQLAAQFNKEIFDLMQKEEAALKKLAQASVFKQTDYLAFVVTMQQQELIYLQALNQYRTDYFTLNYIAGLLDTSEQKLAPPVLPDLESGDFFKSVFYKRFETDSLRIVNERALLSYEYKPKLGVYADAGYTSSLQTTPYKNIGFSAGVSLSIPIYDGHQRRMKEQQIELKESTRINNRVFFVDQYLMQKAQMQRQVEDIDLLVSKIEKQIEYAHTLIVANGKLLETGDITMKDYALAINSYLTAQNLLTLNTVSRLKILGQASYWNIKP